MKTIAVLIVVVAEILYWWLLHNITGNWPDTLKVWGVGVLSMVLIGVANGFWKAGDRRY